MNLHFNCTELIQYRGTAIQVHWVRREYKKKTNICIFENDDGTMIVEKDYISFEYNGVKIEDSYESDEHDLENRVFQICHMIDNGKFEELTALNVNWKK